MITVYSKPNCVNCIKLKTQFKNTGIDFTEVNILEDDEAREMLVSKGLMSLPVVDLDGELILGTTLIN